MYQTWYIDDLDMLIHQLPNNYTSRNNVQKHFVNMYVGIWEKQTQFYSKWKLLYLYIWDITPLYIYCSIFISIQSYLNCIMRWISFVMLAFEYKRCVLKIAKFFRKLWNFILCGEYTEPHIVVHKVFIHFCAKFACLLQYSYYQK